MDCVDRLARASVDALSEHTDVLAALQSVLLAERDNSCWLVTDDAACGFVHAARTLVSFLRDQTMSLVSVPSPSEHAVARSAVMQAAVSLLIAVAGHPSARQWLHDMPEAGQLACALQNLPRVPQHIPLVHGGRTLHQLIYASAFTCMREDLSSDCSDTGAAFQPLQHTESSSLNNPIDLLTRNSTSDLCSLGAEVPITCHRRSSAVDAMDQSCTDLVSAGSHSSPLREDWDHSIIDPIHAPSPEATVIVEPFLEMYRRSRSAVGSNPTTARPGLQRFIPTASDTPCSPSWTRCASSPISHHNLVSWTPNCHRHSFPYGRDATQLLAGQVAASPRKTPQIQNTNWRTGAVTAVEVRSKTRDRSVSDFLVLSLVCLLRTDLHVITEFICSHQTSCTSSMFQNFMDGNMRERQTCSMTPKRIL